MIDNEREREGMWVFLSGPWNADYDHVDDKEGQQTR
jgi:hypothetical protein